MKTWKDECGVFGIWNHEEASRLTYLGLYALQHRGQESAGIVSLADGKHIHHKALGLVGDVFSETTLDRLVGRAAIGHVRYSTTGDNQLMNAQPLTAHVRGEALAVAHNGNIVNASDLRRRLNLEGAIFQGSTDTEVLLHLLAHHAGQFIEALEASLSQLTGAYSMLLMNQDSVLAARDPWGFRPLVLGEKDGAVVFSSETSAFDLIGARYIREIEPGEIVRVSRKGIESFRVAQKVDRQARCIFEHVYFARPDSLVFGQSVYEVRKRMGAQLAVEAGVDADYVIPVPDSGVPAAIGYSQKSGVPFELGIIRNHYVGRTFIEPKQAIRSFGVKIKLNPQSSVLKGQRVIVIDDSLVRGTTSKKLINLIRHAGAKEIHLRIAAPPTTGPCYYGVDTPQRKELIAAESSVEQIRAFVGADSLAYLSIEGLRAAAEATPKTHCAACFDGNYPTQVPEP